MKSQERAVHVIEGGLGQPIAVILNKQIYSLNLMDTQDIADLINESNQVQQ